jgi:hypothetical protein
MKTFARAVMAISTLSLAAGATPTFAQQGGTLTQIVLRTCPAPLGASCVAAVQGAIDSMPRGAARNAELLAMSAALADRARGIFVTKAMCEDIAAGIRLASGAVTNAADREALITLADSLCQARFETAGIGDLTPPPSLVAGGGGGGTPPVTDDDDDQDEDEDEDEEEEEEEECTEEQRQQEICYCDEYFGDDLVDE